MPREFKNSLNKKDVLGFLKNRKLLSRPVAPPPALPPPPPIKREKSETPKKEPTGQKEEQFLDALSKLDKFEEDSPRRDKTKKKKKKSRSRSRSRSRTRRRRSRSVSRKRSRSKSRGRRRSRSRSRRRSRSKERRRRSRDRGSRSRSRDRSRERDGRQPRKTGRDSPGYYSDPEEQEIHNNFDIHTLYVAGIPPDWRNPDLEKLFRPLGATNATVVFKSDGRCRCFGFVDFKDQEHCIKAMQEMNGTMPAGCERKLHVCLKTRQGSAVHKLRDKDVRVRGHFVAVRKQKEKSEMRTNRRAAELCEMAMKYSAVEMLSMLGPDAPPEEMEAVTRALAMAAELRRAQVKAATPKQ